MMFSPIFLLLLRSLIPLLAPLTRHSRAVTVAAAAGSYSSLDSTGDDDQIGERGQPPPPPPPRDVLSFDFGWKHRTGLTRRALPDDPPPVHTDPGLTPPESRTDYDDSSSDSDWTDVRLPHDGLIANGFSTKACPDGCSGKSFIPRHVLWYRKTFHLPEEWGGGNLDGCSRSTVWLEFEGSFRNTTVWVNGRRVANHVCGYTPFRVRLDDIPGINFGPDDANVVAVFVDPDNGDLGGRDHGSGWWYEGGGLYRHVNLVRTAGSIHVTWDGLFVHSDVIFGDGGGGKNAKEAIVHASVELTNGGGTTDGGTTDGKGEDDVACVSFTLTYPDGSPVASAGPVRVTVPVEPMGHVDEDASAIVNVTMHIKSPKLWSLSSPSLYTVKVTVDDCEGTALDAVSTKHGIRSLRYDADEGFFLNEQHFKIRGFCDHDNFAVVGMAVPDRINLFRARASMAIGGNGRRTSQHPPDPSILAIYDRLGMVVMDENRLFANRSEYVANMGAMVRRDRNHPSVVIWSFCNENGCSGGNEKGAPSFQAVTERYDGTRPTLGNMYWYDDFLARTVDVPGFSHRPRELIDSIHAKLPHKPIFMSECCSCNTMRDEDVGCETLHDNPHRNCTQMSFNARCLESNQNVNASDGADYAVGTMIWTLFDYYGEPSIRVGDPEVSSSYGQFDICGFPKAAAFWFRTQWLLSIPDGRSDKTLRTNGAHEVHIVESWESPDSFPNVTTSSGKNATTRSIHAYSNAASIELLVNDRSVGPPLPVRRMVDGPGSYAEWTAVPWEAGRITAVARDGEGNRVATTDRYTDVGGAARLVLGLDAPSPTTGTGSALLLDGQDSALVRASVVDAAGRVVHLATNNVTFAILSGPGVVQGTSNGDPRCHEPNDAPWHSFYHGLVRAVVRVTSVAARSERERSLLGRIDRDGVMAAAAGRESAGLDVVDDDDIIVEASSPGLKSVQLTIPTSKDPSTASVLAVAEAGGGEVFDFFAESWTPAQGYSGSAIE